MSKFRRVGAVALVAGVLAAVVATSAFATSAKAKGCGTVSIGMLAPITGPAGSIGSDQLHWAQYFIDTWNKSGQKPTLKLVQGDTQLDPSKASTVAQQFASDKTIVGVIGPAGSDEVQAVAGILGNAGLAFTSGSATRVSLTAGPLKGFFFRDVPNDGVQGPTDANYMTKTLGVQSGDGVMIVDDQESYSTGLADIVQAALKAKGVNVDRESVSQKANDFSSLIAKVTSSTKVVFLPFQIASEAQLFAQQLKAQGKSAVVFGSDGTFDSSKFNAPGAYVSFFAPDVTTIAADAKIVAGFHKVYPGATSPFGAPNYVLAQMYATAIQQVCQKTGTATRKAVRLQLAKTSLSSTILGTPMKFDANGDVAGAAFHIFKIQPDGSYKTVA
ncbi:MAG: branched-chain amino acid ABC transporter substrate-binding protein [Actinobacteria bacterium]|nr:branched-chain amino acid ABC transporter substrate-binding protein [Actinomycetota bacterium]MBV8562163.1 branched-chain amino acid ABC transporter substrate-binding protein [Actinomycetota bacterium]